MSGSKPKAPGSAGGYLLRRYEVTDAAVHDSQKLDGLLTKGNTSAKAFADSAYRSTEIEGRLRAIGFKSRIHRRATRNHRCRTPKRMRTTTEAKFALASSACSQN